MHGGSSLSDRSVTSGVSGWQSHQPPVVATVPVFPVLLRIVASQVLLHVQKALTRGMVPQ